MHPMRLGRNNQPDGFFPARQAASIATSFPGRRELSGSKPPELKSPSAVPLLLPVSCSYPKLASCRPCKSACGLPAPASLSRIPQCDADDLQALLPKPVPRAPPPFWRRPGRLARFSMPHLLDARRRNFCTRRRQERWPLRKSRAPTILVRRTFWVIEPVMSGSDPICNLRGP